MTKVLHIFGKMRRGGAEMRTLEIMPYLREKGVDFDFCTLGDGEGELDETIRCNGATVSNCPLSVGIQRFSRNFCRLLIHGKYDAVHSHVYYFSGKILQLAHKAGVQKRIAHFRTLHDGKTMTWKRKLYHIYMKYLINRYATDILSVCESVMDSSWQKWKTDPRCRVIYNGINLAPFESLPNTRSDVCREFQIDNRHRILINVGSIQTAKAHDVLLDAMAQIIHVRPDTDLLLIGEGELREEMVRKTRLLGIGNQVHFLGLRDDVPRLLKAADCFMLSSRREGLPGVVLEALAAELPIAATDLPGVREIAGFSHNITVVPVEDSTALFKAAVQILMKLEKETFQSDVFPAPFDLLTCVNKFFDMYASC